MASRPHGWRALTLRLKIVTSLLLLVVTVAIGVVTNIVTDRFTWAGAAVLVVLVVGAGTVQAAASWMESQTPQDDAETPPQTETTVQQASSITGGTVYNVGSGNISVGVSGRSLTVMTTALLAVAALVMSGFLLAMTLILRNHEREATADQAPNPAVVAQAQVTGGDCAGGGWVVSDTGTAIPAASDTNFASADQTIASGTAIGVTVQGSNEHAAILHGVRVEVMSVNPAPASGAILPKYCQGDPTIRSFRINLDAALPEMKPVDGDGDTVQARAFPYQVSNNEPEQWFIEATTTRDISWRLILTWTSQEKQLTTVIDNNGRPFHTVGTQTLRRYCPGAKAWSPPPCAG
jgi:hypothetical protein